MRIPGLISHNNASIIRRVDTEFSVDRGIARIRAYAAEMGWSKSRFAKEAGMNDTTLRDFHKSDWNPTRDTLRRLEAIIPQIFVPDNTAPASAEQA